MGGAALAVAVVAFGRGEALAQSPSATGQSESGFAGLMETLGMKPKAVPAPDFIEKSRPAPDALHYMPVGAPHRGKAERTMSPAEVAAATEQLDKLRMEQQRRAGLKAVPVPLKSDQKATTPRPR